MGPIGPAVAHKLIGLYNFNYVTVVNVMEAIVFPDSFQTPQGHSWHEDKILDKFDYWM